MPGFENGERWRLGKDLLTVSKLNDTDALKALLTQFLTQASKDSRLREEEKGEASERQKEELLGKDTSLSTLSYLWLGLL